MLCSSKFPAACDVKDTVASERFFLESEALGPHHDVIRQPVTAGTNAQFLHLIFDIPETGANCVKPTIF
jgi:hypothetical protein